MLDKKNHKTGFTLAEVLITLAIIGILASLVIPSILNYFEKQATLSKLKEAYSMFSQAVNQIKNDNGGSLVGVFSSTDADYNLNIWAQYLKTIKICHGQAKTLGYCWPQNTYNLDNTAASDYDSFHSTTSGMVLANGMTVAVMNGVEWDWGPSLGAGDNGNNCTGGHYNEKECTGVVFDLNGLSAPNRVGRDIFQFIITPDGVRTLGNEWWTDCNNMSVSSNYKGMGCTYQIINLDNWQIKYY